MQVFELKGELRTDLGKKATKALRAEGKVPCVLYGGGENIHFAVAERALQNLLYTPIVYIVKLDIDGKTYTLSDFNGKALYVDMWASWCGPCCEEIPYLAELYEELGPDSDIQCISISIDEGRQDWLDKLGLPIPETTDDLYNTLKAFKTQDPNGNGLNDEIPFSFIFNHQIKGKAKG